MTPCKASPHPPGAVPPFDAQAFLDSPGTAKTIREYRRGETIFTRGDACQDVLYIQTGGVRLSVLSKTGREAVVATVGSGEFFGEGCLAGQPLRMSDATAITPSIILLIRKARMLTLLGTQPRMADRFIAHLLSRSIRIEEDLCDALFNSPQKRLARALLLMARYGTPARPAHVLRKVSAESLADKIGATPALVKVLLASFTKQGFIDYDEANSLTIYSSLLTVLLREDLR